MDVKEQLLREIDALSPRSIMTVYNYVLTLKENERAHSKKAISCGHMRACRALKNCVGSLSDDVVKEEALNNNRSNMKKSIESLLIIYSRSCFSLTNSLQKQ